MDKKQIKMWVIILEAVSILALFFPAGRIINSPGKESNSLSVFGMIARYGGVGFSDDALFYMILACALPAAVVLSMLVIRERRNFGVATLLSALQAAAAACFFTAASRQLVDYSAMTLLPYLIVFLALGIMALLIMGYMSAYTPQGGDGAANDDSGNKKE